MPGCRPPSVRRRVVRAHVHQVRAERGHRPDGGDDVPLPDRLFVLACESPLRAHREAVGQQLCGQRPDARPVHGACGQLPRGVDQLGQGETVAIVNSVIGHNYSYSVFSVFSRERLAAMREVMRNLSD